MFFRVYLLLLVTVPIVSVVVEGGPGTLEMCYDVLKRGIPILIFEVGKITCIHFDRLQICYKVT